MQINDGTGMSTQKINSFVEWLEWQATRHYEQRAKLKDQGHSDIAYGVKLEARTYERVLTAFWQVHDGKTPEHMPSR
jgi:hypothetical protein